MDEVTNEPKRLGIKEARLVWPTIVREAAAGDRFVITFHDKDRCAVVSMEDLAKLQGEARKPAKRRK